MRILLLIWGTAVPYICRAGFWTIGYGHICDPKHPPITEAEAEVCLARDLQSALAATLRYCPVLASEPEDRLAAIVDFTFNLGAGRLLVSVLRRRINQRDWVAAGHELRKWVYGGKKMLRGLVFRRGAEITLFFRIWPYVTRAVRFCRVQLYSCLLNHQTAIGVVLQTSSANAISKAWRF